MGRGIKLTNFVKFYCFIVAFIFISFAFNNSVFASKSEIIHDNCSVIKIAGIKTGYICSIQREKVENGKKYIITDRHFEQKIKRLNNTIQVIKDTNYVEEESGRPVSFLMTSESSGEKINISGKFIDKKENEINKNDLNLFFDSEMSVDTEINGVKTSKNIKFKDKILFPYAIDNLYKYSDNKNINYATIEPSIDLRAIKIKTEKQGQEKLNIKGLSKNYFKYKVSINILPGIASYEWRDRNGQVVKESAPLLNMETILSSKKEIADIPDDYDLFSGGLIYINKNINDPDSINQINYKITADNTTALKDIFLNDERQKTKQINKGVIYLTINNVQTKTESYSYPLETKGLEEYLKSGPFIMPDSDKILTAAKLIVADETDAYVISKKMEKWVYNNITKKDYSVDFSNAIQTLETKSGDCTEHSVLLASLLRAAGIPSKIVVGLIYTDIPKPAFGYHMWVKAYIGSKSQPTGSAKKEWINLDAALPYKNFVPTHIAMAESPLNNISDRADLLINIMKSFSGIKIEVLNFEKPLISKLNDGMLKVDFQNKSDNNFLTIKTNNITSGNLNNSGIKNISLNGSEDKDFLKSALYNFIKGDIQKSYDDYNVFYNSIYKDDFSYMILGLKLSNMGFFNLAAKAFDNVKDKKQWGLQITNIKNSYFPRKKYSDSEEMVISDALSKIEFQILPDAGINLINKNKFQNNDYAHYLLAKAYIAKNKVDFSQNHLRKAIKINPENLSYKIEQAKIYIQKNNYKAAEKELSTIKELAEKYNLKDRDFWQEFYEQNYWLKFKAERKNPLKSKYYKAKYYEAKNENNIALEVLNSILKGNADKVLVYESLGDVYFKLGQIDKAEQNFNKALEINEKNISALNGLGKIYFSKNNFKAALEKFKTALEADPDNNELKFNIAQVYETLGQEEQAYNCYKDVLSDNLLNFEANYKLGMMYFKSGDIDEAEKFLKKALFVDSLNNSVWLDITAIELAKENYSVAKNYLKPISYTDEKNAYYYYYSALIEKAKGNLDAAKENFDRALELKPDFDEANQALQKL